MTAIEVLIGTWRAPVPRRRADRWKLCLSEKVWAQYWAFIGSRLQGTAARQSPSRFSAIGRAGTPVPHCGAGVLARAWLAQA